MSVIPAATVKVQTMADDTLRIVLDIEPRDAQTAFMLFGQRGTPVALAALKVGTPTLEQDEKPKGGPLARWAAMRGQDPAYQEWLEAYSPEAVEQRIKTVCGVKSRAELDNDELAASVFKAKFIDPWRMYCQQNGIGGSQE